MTDLELVARAADYAAERIETELHHAVATEHAKAFRIFAEEILLIIKERIDEQ